jgi:hypothetical protein
MTGSALPPSSLCSDCGLILTDEEAHYYHTRCETCVRKQDERIDRWRRGGEDAELDFKFGAPIAGGRQ